MLLLLLNETQAVGECPKILANESHTRGAVLIAKELIQNEICGDVG